MDDPIHMLIAASKAGKVSTVRDLLSGYQDPEVKRQHVNGRNSMGRTALQYAARKEHWDIVHLLCDAGADVSVVDGDGKTVLMYASESGEECVVSDVLSRFIDPEVKRHFVNRSDKLGRTALHIVAGKGRWDIVRLLCDAGADVSMVDEDGITVLMYASEAGDVFTVKDLLSGFTDPEVMREYVNRKDRRGISALHLSAGKGRWDIVRILCDAGADVTVVDEDGKTILMFAPEAGDMSVVRDLLSRFTSPGAKSEYLNRCTSSGISALHVAAGKKHWDIVRLLCDAGADVSVVDGDGRTILMYAAEAGDMSAVSDVLSRVTDTRIKRQYVNRDDSSGRTALHIAAGKKHWDVVRLLCDAGADVTVVDGDGKTVLMAACRAGDGPTVRYLLSRLTDPGTKREYVNSKDRRGCSALHVAAGKKHWDIVRLLADAGADVSVVDEDGRTILMAACRDGDVSMVKDLLSRFKDPEVKREYVRKDEIGGRTALHMATGKGHVDIVRILCDAGADVSVVDEDGRTILMYAPEAGDACLVKELLCRIKELGIKREFVNRHDRLGRTALQVAAALENWDIVRLLCEAGAHLSVVDEDGRTVLMAAARAGDEPTVTYLLSRFTDPRIKREYVRWDDRRGRTALQYAVRKEHWNVVRLLCEAGADVSVMDADGRTVLMAAARRGDVALATAALSSESFPDLEHKCMYIDKQDNHGRTALFYAACEGYSDIVRLLIAHGADVSLPDNDGMTPLMVAARTDMQSEVEALLESITSTEQKRLYVNSVDSLGRSALFYATMYGHCGVMNVLIDADADTRVRDENEWNLLMVASREGKMAAVSLLLARPDRTECLHERDRVGRTALQHARERGRDAVVGVLTEAGAVD